MDSQSPQENGRTSSAGGCCEVLAAEQPQLATSPPAQTEATYHEDVGDGESDA
jgi:hypothetical protein